MKILHTADLHLGKRVNEFSMIEDQSYILDQIFNLCKNNNIEVLLIAGDIYDKAIPPIDAINLFDNFLNLLNSINVTVLCISGNHDSNERLNFASNLLESNNIYIVSEFEKELKKISIKDIDFYLLPFVKYTYLNHCLDEKFVNYQEAMEYILLNNKLDKSKKNILIAHQFVTVDNQNPDLSDSETKSIGGLDSIDFRVFKDFDYVALGHIHKPQAMGRQTVRYSGSILKYSFSEVNVQKSVCLIDTEIMSISNMILNPIHDMLKFESSINEILEGKTLESYPSENYYQIILNDEEEIIDAISKVRSIYPNIMQLNFKKRMNIMNEKFDINENDIINHSAKQLFSDFFQLQNHSDLNDTQLALLSDIIKEVED
jgi:exonuclease SbcD